MDDLKKIAIKKSDKEDTDEDKVSRVMDWLWGAEEKRTVLGLLKGKKKEKKT